MLHPNIMTKIFLYKRHSHKIFCNVCKEVIFVVPCVASFSLTHSLMSNYLLGQTHITHKHVYQTISMFINR